MSITTKDSRICAQSKRFITGSPPSRGGSSRIPYYIATVALLAKRSVKLALRARAFSDLFMRRAGCPYQIECLYCSHEGYLLYLGLRPHRRARGDVQRRDDRHRAADH